MSGLGKRKIMPDRQFWVGLTSDERPLSGFRIQRQLSGDESEVLTVATRPIAAPFSKISSVWLMVDG